MQKYPIGIQNFRELIEGGYLYIDKTAYIHRLATTGKYYFLSRPRRFGKSLLISTFQALYEGEKGLFKGLFIEDKWDFTKTNPIITVYFNSMQLNGNDLDDLLQNTIREQALINQIELNYDTDKFKRKSGLMFQELIQKLHQKTNRKVVVLIDEYDKPIIDFLENLDIANENRDILKSFYGILKPCDEYLELVLLTGVSKFSKVSIFSDLNQLNDISIEKRYGAITGITQAELEQSFEEELVILPDRTGHSKIGFLENIKNWYNGYSWTGESVYNPFSILNFFSKEGSFQNFWFSTGTPTWLVKQVLKHREFDYEGIEVTQSDLDTFQIEDLSPVALLFQTGYLTIKSYSTHSMLYTLGYPNLEVKTSFTDHLLQAYRGDIQRSVIPATYKLSEALEAKDLDKVFSIINTVYSTLPYDLWQKENEKFYHALIHLTFTLLGTYIQSEIHTAEGRCDALVQTKSYIYAFEFKLDKTPQEALDQIEAKGYLKPYQESEKTMIGIGVNFTKERKGVESWLEKSF